MNSSTLFRELYFSNVEALLVCLSPDWLVQIRALAGDIVLCSRARHLLSQCLSSPRFINGYRQTKRWGYNPAMD